MSRTSELPPALRWLSDFAPILICGGTQNGKTVTANCIQHQAADAVSIVWNPEPEPFIRGRVAESIGDVGRLIDAGARCIDYRPTSWQTDDLRDEHEQLVEMLFRLNDPHDFDQPFLLVTDELHEIAPSGGPETSVHRAHKRGEKRGVQQLGISQDYATIPNTVIRQSSYKLYVGRPDEFEESYMADHGLPFDELRQNDEHQAAVVQGGQVVDRFTVSAEYAEAP